MKYAPLEHIEDIHNEQIYASLIKGGLKNELVPERFYEGSFAEDTDMWKGHNDKFRQVMDRTVSFFTSQDIREIVHKQAPDVDTTGWRDTTPEDIRALMLKYAVLDKWAECKQVYEFDPDFAEALIDTKELKVYPEIVSHLPYDTFYIDLRRIPRIKDIGEIYVHVHFFPDGQGIIYYITFPVGVEGVSGYSRTCRLTDEVANTDEHGHRFYWVDKESFVDQIGQQDADGEMFLFQAINFLASEKPDIAENEITKKTYKPSPRIKNKFSEIRKWDVGFRYGSVIRDEKKAVADDTVTAIGTINHRHSPRPHTRCAHWQTVWTGKGRTIPKVRWFRQTFVGAGKTTAVIHKVKQEK